MEAHRDPALCSDAILPSDNDDDLEDVPQATLKLLSDFPEPLTEPQRRTVQHHVTQRVREFELVRRQVAVVELGYLALLRLVTRLRKEQAALQASLADEGVTKVKTPTSMLAINATPSAVSSSAESPQIQGNSASKEATAGPKRRPGGVLLRSAVFNGLQRVLQAAKTEQHDEKAEQLAKQRERIAKESRLHLVSEDLAAQEALLEPLQRKYNRAVALAQEAADKVAPLLTLLEDMWRLEALYPSCFSMHASGALEPLMWATNNGGSDGSNCGDAAKKHDANEEENETQAGAEKSKSNGGVSEANSGTSPGAAVSFVVPFTPAQYTNDVEDLIRAQVEDVIDEYLAYRTRIDPVLYQLEQAQQVAKAQRVDQLMDIIGIKGAGAGTEVLPMGGGVGGASTAATGQPSDRSSVVLVGKSAEDLLNISSEEEDDNVGGASAMADDTADKDRQDREQIRTALTALDDFEDA